MENIYCPSCLGRNKLSKVNIVGLIKKKYKCSTCKARYPLNATLISEDAVRWYIRNSKGRLDYLLKEI